MRIGSGPPIAWLAATSAVAAPLSCAKRASSVARGSSQLAAAPGGTLANHQTSSPGAGTKPKKARLPNVMS